MTGPGGARRRPAAVAALTAAVLAVSGCGPAVQAGERESRSEIRLRQAGRFAVQQMARTERQLGPGRFPTVVAGGPRWRTSGTDGWLAGFWPGRLWAAYELTGRPVWKRRALRAQSPLAGRASDTTTHDLGFLLQTSFGRAATLTGSRRSARVLRRAAGSLASRWVPQVGALRSWDGPAGQVTVIVDNLVNLELLFAAARSAGRPAWHDLAVRHALTSAAQHVRPDGSTTHVVRFDEVSGDPVWRGTVQGLRDDSTWARGQSWAVLGFTTAYRESREPRLLEPARRTADFAIGHLPRDGVPFWDYAAPAAGDRTRDTTAAAALAAALLELARIDPDPARRATYAEAGRHTLRTLAGPRYLARGTRSPAILRHGRHDARYSDAGVTYGDYYFVEALLREQLLPSPGPPLPARVRLGARGDARAVLGAAHRVSAVSVRWRRGATRAVRFRVATSPDGRAWSPARGGVSSGRVTGFETYDLPDRTARYVRVTVLGAGGVRTLRVLG
jgi:unsaturated chondroitin disaccharide hydrolase